MSKILAVSDIHINDWDNRDPKTRFRLHQNRIVANNIVEAGRREGADIIVFCGDLFHKALNSPQILAETNNFLRTIMANFKYGFIVWGNHDMNNKNDQQDFIDCPANVMLPENLYYADSKETVIDNSRVAFSNWKPKFDLGWISGKVDVLFTHATIQYKGGPVVNSQILDDTKFNLAICGDIHYPGQNGKYISIGNPQQNKLDDSEKQSGVIYDTTTKSWYWTDLNPHDNLLKFRRTTESVNDGYDESTNTWFVYQPKNIVSNGSLNTSLIPGGSEIIDLIDNIVCQEQLEDIHREVLGQSKSSDLEEVDFNYTITGLRCHNWRSIDDLDLKFQPGERILLQGRNGSGKSSILSALKYAFCDTKDTPNLRTLDSFVRSGEKNCWTEVEFWYQGKNCIIRRGNSSKDNYCIIDGQKLNYSKKTDFEVSMRKKFPFINYFKAFFFSGKGSSFIGSCGEDLNQIISKYLRLDQIDLYHKTASDMLVTLIEKSKTMKQAYDSAISSRDYIQSKILEIKLPDRSLEFLEKDRLEGLKLQDSYNKYQETKLKISGLQGQIDFLKKSESDNKSLLGSLKNSWLGDSKIQEIQSEISKNQEFISTVNSQKQEKQKLSQELQELWAKGNSLNTTITGLHPSKCPTCGQSIELDTFNKYRDALIKDLNDITEKYNSLKSRYDSIDFNDSEISQINNTISDLQNQLLGLYQSKTQIDTISRTIEEYQKDIEAKTKELDSLKSQAGQEIELPNGFLNIMESIVSGINAWKTHDSLNNDLNNLNTQIDLKKNDMEKISRDINLLNKYIKITSPVGIIYEAILSKLAKEFSDNYVEYTVRRNDNSKKEHLELIPIYIKGKLKTEYAACSTGEQAITDIHLLSKITTCGGLLVLDEFFANVDPSNYDYCVDIVNKMNIGLVLLVSHLESATSYYNKVMMISKPDTVTKINVV